MPIRFLSTAKPYGDYPVAESQDIQHGDKRLNVVIGEIQTVNASKADKTYVDTEIAKKVDKETGKGLSTNDYTTAEKAKLGGIAEGATKVTVDSSLSTTSTNAVQNKAVATAINSKAEKSYVDTEIAKKVDKETGKGLSTNDYTTAEKTKLAGIATGATKVTVDDTLSSTSSNPIANGPVTTALSGKVDKVTGKGLSANDYTSAEKTKLSGIEAGATKTIVDDTLTTSSTNPIQNKAVATALSSKADSSTVSSLATTVSGKADSSTVSVLTSRVSTNETNIATQTSRIDNIAALPSGSTSGDAELMDIRVGADSKTYTSAGAAVRAQITDVKSDLDSQFNIIHNGLTASADKTYSAYAGSTIELRISKIAKNTKIKFYLALTDSASLQGSPKLQYFNSSGSGVVTTIPITPNKVMEVSFDVDIYGVKAFITPTKNCTATISVTVTSMYTEISDVYSKLETSINDVKESRTLTQNSPEISAYYSGWLDMNNISIAKGTKAVLTLKDGTGAVRDNGHPNMFKADGTYYSPITLKPNVPTEYTFEHETVRIKVNDVVTTDGYFTLDVKILSLQEQINNIEYDTSKVNYKYPPYAVWGHEYMLGWYSRLYNGLGGSKILCVGDSTTKNSNRETNAIQILTARGYSESKFTGVNMGIDGATTETWLTKLDEQMATNPNLMIVGYGLNDGSKTYYESLSMQERANGFETRLREALGRIRTNQTFASGDSYYKSAKDLAIIITTPVSISSTTSYGLDNTADAWCVLIDPIIKKACRDYQCVYADFTSREYDHEFTKEWSISQDGIHPQGFITKEMMGMLADVICPLTYSN